MLRYWASAAAPMVLWIRHMFGSPEHGETIPERQYTLRLDTAVPIGGQVVDESGKPIAGAAVTVWLDANVVRENDSVILLISPQRPRKPS